MIWLSYDKREWIKMTLEDIRAVRWETNSNQTEINLLAAVEKMMLYNLSYEEDEMKWIEMYCYVVVRKETRTNKQSLTYALYGQMMIWFETKNELKWNDNVSECIWS